MLRILIIEDDLIDQLALTRMIKKNSLECEVTLSMKIFEAATLLNTQAYDLVICDLNLPDGNAFDLKHLIKNQPFVLLSGHIEPDIVKKAMDYGSIKILQKSSDLSQLSYISNLIKAISGQQLDHNHTFPSKGNPTHLKFNIEKLMDTFDQKEEEVIEIIELFINGNPQLMADILSAVREGNRPFVKLMLHRLKSNCRMIGLKDQHLDALRIEQLALHEKLTVLENEVIKLQSSLEKVSPLLKAATLELKKL